MEELAHHLHRQARCPGSARLSRANRLGAALALAALLALFALGAFSAPGARAQSASGPPAPVCAGQPPAAAAPVLAAPGAGGPARLRFAGARAHRPGDPVVPGGSVLGPGPLAAVLADAARIAGRTFHRACSEGLDGARLAAALSGGGPLLGVAEALAAHAEGVEGALSARLDGEGRLCVAPRLDALSLGAQASASARSLAALALGAVPGIERVGADRWRAAPDARGRAEALFSALEANAAPLALVDLYWWGLAPKAHAEALAALDDLAPAARGDLFAPGARALRLTPAAARAGAPSLPFADRAATGAQLALPYGLGALLPLRTCAGPGAPDAALTLWAGDDRALSLARHGAASAALSAPLVPGEWWLAAFDPVGEELAALWLWMRVRETAPEDRS